MVLTRDGVSPIEEYDFPGIEQQSQAKAPSAASQAKALRQHVAPTQAVPMPQTLQKAARRQASVADTKRDACKGPFAKNIMRRQLPDLKH